MKTTINENPFASPTDIDRPASASPFRTFITADSFKEVQRIRNYLQSCEPAKNDVARFTRNLFREL